MYADIIDIVLYGGKEAEKREAIIKEFLNK